MGAAGGHPPYHCHAVPLHANNVSPPFSGVPRVLSTDDSGGRPEAVLLAQGPSSWAGAALPSTNQRDFAPGARPQCSPGLPVHPPSGGALRSFFADVSVWAPRGRPFGAGPLPRAGAAPSPQSAGFRVWSAAPISSRAPGVLPVRRGPAGLLHRCLCVGTQGAAPLTQGLFLGPGRHCLFSPRGSTRGA
ncbi:hypothetical protein NDU88_008704 [Pleurodeles waltl]|uniref:Uncharacterized protein n=1 Tax=Pleurodeles waltl TaxID=8319 RepID=A0AAV7RUK0_PLEWA|nr:hypothetical protein NDU88_008704 [Pleurodeles waltl]